MSVKCGNHEKKDGPVYHTSSRDVKACYAGQPRGNVGNESLDSRRQRVNSAELYKPMALTTPASKVHPGDDGDPMSLFDAAIQQKEREEDEAVARFKADRDDAMLRRNPPTREELEAARPARGTKLAKAREFIDPKTIPAAKYALIENGHVKFYQVEVGKENSKWAGFRFVRHLVGAPTDWRKFDKRGGEAMGILRHILEDSYTYVPEEGEPRTAKGPEAGVLRYAALHQRCAVCEANLSDDKNKGPDGLTSMSRGIGPVCATRFRD